MATDDEPSPSRAPGCLALFLMIAALPLAALGAVIYVSSDAEGAGHGIGGALGGLGMVTGVILVGIAALLFVVGAVIYALAARR